MSNVKYGGHRAREVLEAVSRKLPGVWALHENSREVQWQHADWPEWCYSPLTTAYALVAEYPKHEQGYLALKITALATWRLSQGIYRVDPTLMTALVDTPLEGAIPVDILLRLPEWGIYIELPQGVPTDRGVATGVWVWLEPTHNEANGITLFMLFDTGGDADAMLQDSAFYPFPLPLTGESLINALSRVYPSSEADNHMTFRRIVEPVLSILLYLCSKNSDLTRGGLAERPVRATPVKTRRKGSRLFAADGATTWDVGIRLGTALRRAYEIADQSHSSSPGDGEPTVIGHIRRAHWHTVLSGPRKDVPTPMRKRDLRWMPPIPVNLPDFDQLVATIRPVK